MRAAGVLTRYNWNKQNTWDSNEPALASGATMPPVQTVYADQQVPLSQCTVIPDRHVRPHVNDNWSITSTVMFTP